MRRPSVAIIGTRGYPSYYGGFETAIRHLAPFLAERGWDVTVYGRAGATREDDPYRDNRVRSTMTRGFETKALSTLTYGFTATWHAATHSAPDAALVLNVANGYFLPLLKLRGIPSLVNVDGIEWEREKWGRIAKLAFRGGALFTSRFGTELVYDARAIQDRWAREFHREGTYIPYGGTSPGRLPPPANLSPGGYALIVSRFVPENTVPEFLQAAEIIAKTHPVVLVGSSGYGGPLDETARQMARSNARVTWLGHVADDRLLFSLLQHAGAYFHGHSVGGTNPALVQAMACGSPIIARDTIYNREVLGPDGTFVAPHPTDIASAVIDMLRSRDKQQRAREYVLQRSREEYTWDAVCAGYENALRRLVRAPAV